MKHYPETLRIIAELKLFIKTDDMKKTVEERYKDLIWECMKSTNEVAVRTAKFYFENGEGKMPNFMSFKFSYEEAIAQMENALALSPEKQREMVAIANEIVKQIEPILQSISFVENHKN